MLHPFRLFKAVRLANTLLFVAAVGATLDHSMAAALTRLTSDPHWSTHGHQALVVVDKTGSPSWHRADRAAVDAWNQAATGTGLRLVWTAGSGPCHPETGRVVVCGASTASLDDDAQLSRQGVTHIALGHDGAQAHIGTATVLVCADCRLGPARRRVVATHELGHALGLPHSRRPESVMYRLGGPETPDELDAGTLRALNDHADASDRCGFFDARLGPLCF